MKPSDLKSITNVEIEFGTARLLPLWDEIPAQFKQGNVYTKFAEALSNDVELPIGDLVFMPGYEHCAVDLDRCIRAHLASAEIGREHKIAGVGMMISKVCAILVPPNESIPEVV